MTTDTRIDDFIAKSGDFAKPMLTHFRALVRATEPEAVETIKWGMPHFTINGKILAGMGAFKAHCAIIIEDAGERHGMEGGGMGHFGKIKSEAEMPEDAELVELIQARAARIRTGLKSPTKSRPVREQVAMPDDLAAALRPEALAFLERLTAGHRREYFDWITEAKRPETRAKRIAEAAQLLADGKKRYWKYEDC